MNSHPSLRRRKRHINQGPSQCPNPECGSRVLVRDGFFRRRSDRKKVQRLRCPHCGKRFSIASAEKECGQNKRQVNDPVFQLLCCGVSQNRIARLLHLSRRTVVRKMLFLSRICEKANRELLQTQRPAARIQFDEMETFEHTKCKPLSIALAVEEESRRILGFEVSSMPAKGPLAHIARQKYGSRPDQRKSQMIGMLQKIKPFLALKLHLTSDKCPFYPSAVQDVFAADSGFSYSHHTVKGGRGCITGQGELKKQVFDPIFSLNHTCAMLRANINRLFRRTWCTTKKAERLVCHIHLYVYYHNRFLLKSENEGAAPRTLMMPLAI